MTPDLTTDGTTGPRPSPNIWYHPAVYELENRAVDPERRIEAAMAAVADWTGRDVLDVGCGSGFHLLRFAERARTVSGVEPHPELAALARRRTRRTPSVTVLEGTAQALPLPPRSVDLVHARWAYFFGPGSEPGLAELDRVVRPGGAGFVVDNDPTTSTFGRWFREGYPDVDPEAVCAFWEAQGWRRTPVETEWRFAERADLESVVRIEFPAAVAERLLLGHEGLTVDYAVNLWWRTW